MLVSRRRRGAVVGGGQGVWEEGKGKGIGARGGAFDEGRGRSVGEEREIKPCD